ncbi:MAG TPA: neocarzinostatin apoprotein domain-containing protein [Solirubrobacterales bacterium]|nr:neocarzinostatin apoprotein domain-containing protein [Solirubrobacterales bacterium]
MVSPSSSLLSPATVQVSGSGFPADQELLLMQCGLRETMGIQDPEWCTEPITAQTDGTGNFGPVEMTLTQTFTPSGPWAGDDPPETVDCGIGIEACAIWALMPTVQGEITPITFAQPPPVPPQTPDTDAPETTITKDVRRSETGRAGFRFESDEPSPTFECKLKGSDVKRKLREFHGCDSPRRYKGLEEGRYAFRVRAIDAAGNVDPTPARDRFRVVD